MTNKERLISLLGFAPSDDNSIEGAMTDEGITGSGTYSLNDKPGVRKAAIYLLQMLLSTPDTGNSEPAFSIKYDRLAIQRRLDDLIAEVDPDVVLVPTIRGLHIW